MKKHDEYIYINVLLSENIMMIYIYMNVRLLNGQLSLWNDGLWILAPMSASHLMWYELICIAYEKGEWWFTIRKGNDEKWKGCWIVMI